MTMSMSFDQIQKIVPQSFCVIVFYSEPAISVETFTKYDGIMVENFCIEMPRV